MRSTKNPFFYALWELSVLLIIGLFLPSIASSEDLRATTPLLEPKDFLTAIEEVAEKIGPTVVAIQTVQIQHIQPYYYSGDPMRDEFFRDFFQEFFGPIPEREFRRSGLGSGVIIDERGYILTNNHVVEGANKITVTLPDGRKFDGVLKGRDPRFDLAVIKIDAPNLPTARLGDSDNLRIGQWVVAIGNPFGYIISKNSKPTVTAGVISALHRSLPRTSRRDTDLSDLIQTDAAINPGNSGGPLVNLYGEVIGINAAIFTTSGGSQGIGFAIPINRAKRIVQSLIKGEKIYYGWIGVSVQDVSQSLADYFGLSSKKGALIVQVLDNGPAQAAGLQDGDIILSVNGKDVLDVNTLITTVSEIEPGKTVPIKILRDGKEKVVEVTIGKRPIFDEYGQMVPPTSQEKKSENKVGKPFIAPKQWRGMEVQEITPQEKELYHLDNSQGVIISRIKPESPADEANLRPGDVIISINQQKITTLADFYNVTKGISGDCLIKTNRGYFVIKEH